ncbi:hypothetical protein C8R45DRAFT_973142 [Mycena sanguinolenta]|nr:hypothetical protein C8R45DRAFT_973142 [Mycena sanguinolenta]
MSTTTTTTATRTYTPTATPMSIALSPSISSSVSASTSISAPTTTYMTPSCKAAVASRVRFDAECILIPELGYSYGTKRPRMVTKSYSLPLWKRGGRDGKEEEEVVSKVALPRMCTVFPTLCWRFRWFLCICVYIGSLGFYSIFPPAWPARLPSLVAPFSSSPHPNAALGGGASSLSRRLSL